MKIPFFTPRHRYEPISLTGTWCALNCRFCNRRFIENMIHATPQSFVDLITELYINGVRGVLLSGGFRSDGTLPIEPYIEPLRHVRGKFNMILSAHLGLITSREILEELKDLIDIVDYEFTLSTYILSNVRMLRCPSSTYLDALKQMLESGLHVVPHVFAWHPELDVELFKQELRTLADLGIEEITLLVYIEPTIREKAERIAKAVIRNVELARSSFPGRLYMGCMRPGYVKPLVDPLLIERELVERIANPFYKVVAEHPSDTYDACCSIPLNEKTKELFYIGKNYIDLRS